MFSARMAAAPIRLRGAKQRHPDGYGDGGDTAHASLGPWGRCSVVTVHGALGGCRQSLAMGHLVGSNWDGAALVAGGHLSPVSSQEPGTALSKRLPAHERLPMAPRAGWRQQPQPLCSLITPTTPNLPLISTSTALCPPPEQPSINTSPFSSLHSFPRLWFPDSDPT